MYIINLSLINKETHGYIHLIYGGKNDSGITVEIYSPLLYVES